MKSAALTLLLIGIPTAAASASPADFSTTITDAQTGEPIAGAVLRKIEERPTPITGEIWTSEEFISDSAGHITGSEGSKVDWWFVDATGYAPRAISGSSINPTIELHRGREVTMTLLDALDEPVRGVRLGWMLGCGHAPDSRGGVSDGNGRVVIRDFAPEDDGEWWPSGRGVLSDTLWPEWNQAHTRGVLRCSPAPVREGIVLDSSGAPRVGVFVGQPNKHRGPWSRTDDAGRFRLFGADEWELFVRDQQGRDLGTFPTALPGHPRTIHLGEPQVRDATLQLTTSSNVSHRGVAALVTVIRERDGWNESAQTDSQGFLTLQLASGSYLVQFGGQLRTHERIELPVELSVGLSQTMEVNLVARPTAQVSLMGESRSAPIILATKDSERDITAELDSVALPSEPCVIWTSLPAGRRTHQVTAEDRLPGAVIQFRL